LRFSRKKERNGRALRFSRKKERNGRALRFSRKKERNGRALRFSRKAIPAFPPQKEEATFSMLNDCLSIATHPT
jgi:hypothetical protein